MPDVCQSSLGVSLHAAWHG